MLKTSFRTKLINLLIGTAYQKLVFEQNYQSTNPNCRLETSFRTKLINLLIVTAY